MSLEYPDWLDPRKAAEGRRTFAGSMPLGRMTRLQTLLANGDGEVRFSAGFAFDQQEQVTIDITVDANLPLICQRSLEPYLEPVHRRSLLGVIESIAEEAGMPANYEPVLVENGRLALLDLVEDELILGIPQVPKNPEVAANWPDERVTGSPGVAARNGPTRRPFAGLAELLEKQAQDEKAGR